MKYFYKLLPIIFLLPFVSKAQSNYKPGYVLTIKGDTLHGLIDYKEWENNPKSISFKSSSASPVQVFMPGGAGGFGVTGIEYYSRFVLPISQDQVDIDKAGRKLDTTVVVDTVFLKLNTKGKNLALFSYTDNIKSRYYLLEKGEQQPQELTYHVYNDPSESPSTQFITRYRGQLLYVAEKYAMKTPQLERQVSEAKYKVNDLLKIAEAINGSTDQQFSAPAQNNNRFFAGVGLNYSSLKFTNVPGNGFQRKSTITTGSTLPKITAGIDFFPNPVVQN
jgi:hypothetical protein